MVTHAIVVLLCLCVLRVVVVSALLSAVKNLPRFSALFDPPHFPSFKAQRSIRSAAQPRHCKHTRRSPLQPSALAAAPWGASNPNRQAHARPWTHSAATRNKAFLPAIFGPLDPTPSDATERRCGGARGCVRVSCSAVAVLAGFSGCCGFEGSRSAVGRKWRRESTAD